MILLGLLTVLLSPWKGPPLPTAPLMDEYSKAFALSVRGAPYERLTLSAAHVPKGWIAAFCTPAICSPFHKGLTLNDRGVAHLEFELVPIDVGASRHPHAVILAGNRVVARV